jgi:hypothetical protein
MSCSTISSNDEHAVYELRTDIRRKATISFTQ